jgi:23S rRNA (guanosine2251-2'-O)-methyltransferase
MRAPYHIVFGIHSLIELLRAKRRPVYKIYTTDPRPKAFSSIQALLPRHVEVATVSRTKLNEIAESADHQGVVAAVGAFPFRSSCFRPDKHQRIILLDGIQDPRNVGAIIRSAYCTGFTGVIIPAKQSAPLSGTVIKASAGLTERMDMYQPPSSIAAVTELKKAGYEFYIAHLNGTDARQVSYQSPLCLVIGNEAVGVSPAVTSQGTSVTIPQSAGDVSYNASVAAGILLFLISTRLQEDSFSS